MKKTPVKVPTILSTKVDDDTFTLVDKKVSASKNGPLLSGKMLGKKMSAVKTRLAYSFNSAGAGGAANATVLAVEPATSSEFSQWAALYSEVKVHGGVVHFGAVSTGGNPLAGISGIGSVQYDPLVSTALTTVAGGLEGSQSQIYVLGQNDSAAATDSITSTTAVSKSGLFAFNFAVPKGSARTTATTTNVSGEWCATSDSADTFGWVKFYLPALGGAYVQTVYGYVVLDVSFRSRS